MVDRVTPGVFVTQHLTFTSKCWTSRKWEKGDTHTRTHKSEHREPTKKSGQQQIEAMSHGGEILYTHW